MNPGMTVIHKPALVAAIILALAGFAPAQQPAATLHRAVHDNDLDRLRASLRAGADPDARDSAGRTPLIEAAELGRLDAVRLLIAAGGDLNASSRGSGTALEAAERAGNAQIAALLREAGARTSGKSLGDTVCVRPWGGDGYCGVVESVGKNAYRIRVTGIVGCQDGCPARAECSAGRPVGGPNGIHAGETVSTVVWCLTHTGVQP